MASVIEVSERIVNSIQFSLYLNIDRPICFNEQEMLLNGDELDLDVNVVQM